MRHRHHVGSVGADLSMEPQQKSERPRATIIDVARESGLSIKTVSRVFNDEPFVRPNTRDRVLKAAADLDYHPNMAARSLVRGRSFLVGLFYENPSPNYVVDLQAGALDRLHSERYRLLLFPCESAGQVSGKVLAIARASGLEGLVLAPPMCDDAKTVKELEAARFPFARIAPARTASKAPAVGIDDVAATIEIVEHLIALGHRRIAIVKGDPTHPATTARLNGFRQTVKKHGLPLEPALIEDGMFTFESGLEAGRRLLATPAPPSAIFACNDDMAAGVLTAAKEAGLNVPQQLSVAGFDNSSISRVVWPQLTTIHQPTYEMANRATDALLSLIDGASPVTDMTMPFELLVRGSTAPPG